MTQTLNRLLFQILLIILLIGLTGMIDPVLGQKSWTQTITGVGTFSSPRVSDLNQDGTDDIVLGAGRLEFESCDSAVIAMDGKTGKMLWNVPAKDQVFGSAMFLDVTGDGIAEVFIGGRSAELIAINGATGAVVWRFSTKTRGLDGKKVKWYNFYNPQFIPDQDGDGLKDLLVSNGGDVMVEAYDPDRPPGYLVVLSSKDGHLLAQAEMPDGKEIYMSVTVTETPDGKDHEVLFGTGGETVGGNLYIDYLSNIMKNDLSDAKLLDSSKNKGYIGPAVRVDVTEDGITDIFVCTVDGRLLAYDGDGHQLLWEVVVPNTECYGSIAIGQFTADSIPDLFLSFGRGVWPDLDGNYQHMVNGRTGQVEFTDSLGYFQMASPVAFDYDDDGKDEVLFSVNIQEVQSGFLKFFYNMLVVADFQTGQLLMFGEKLQGNNLSSTPWVGDLDHDGRLDILYCHGDNLRRTYTFDGIKIRRIATQFPIKQTIPWGAYQGSNYDGIFQKGKVNNPK
ncbi:MAG: PQQ-binding-like beta-propeller repeat protein [Bacteroidota bacterium]